MQPGYLRSHAPIGGNSPGQHSLFVNNSPNRAVGENDSKLVEPLQIMQKPQNFANDAKKAVDGILEIQNQ